MRTDLVKFRQAALRGLSSWKQGSLQGLEEWVKYLGCVPNNQFRPNYRITAALWKPAQSSHILKLEVEKTLPKGVSRVHNSSAETKGSRDTVRHADPTNIAQGFPSCIRDVSTYSHVSPLIQATLSSKRAPQSHG